MIAALVGWLHAILAYLVSGIRTLGAAYSVYGDDHD
jgi:hypothetical protein